ncbi:unnamed protein product [Tilletia controversa]|uniref:Transcription initiation factor TFIID subunit 4 n=3 Tax=Tilletia TaxID=13289 RepID=A0A8X7MW83_9BASI|nr:hypothetical protein CF336_g2188 [Tilletia laevis]KAE8202639.1 hypothetical protein CF328_g2100 [Tilletia controversa]CAD6887993.1 unnamed protein product [Tilletia caries]KAE8206973.1 hypothetical protein CF335_g1490 [Tilletia laevis]KAE8251745.1 hypothetical protein A4X06_0g2552 [Tilletia controversa]
MSSGSGRSTHPNSSNPSGWSPSRYPQQQQPPSPSINNVPRSNFVPEIVIPRRTSSSASPGNPAFSPSASYSSHNTAAGLLRPPSQQVRYQQQQQQQSSSSSTTSYATHYASSSSTGSARYGAGASGSASASGSYAAAYEGAAAAAGVTSAPTASHEDSLADVMGSAGVDLRAEEEAMQSQTRFASHPQPQHRPAQTYAQNTSSQPKRTSGGLFLEVYPLSMKVHSIAAMHGLGVEPDVLNYLSLTARTRFRNLAEAMVATARHRIWSTAHARPPPLYPDDPSSSSSSSSSFRHKGKARGTEQMDAEHEPKPMYHEQLISDPTKQLSAIEKAEREEEGRARRRRAARVERENAEQAFLAALIEEEKSGAATSSAGNGAIEAGLNGDKKGGQVPNGSHGGDKGASASASAGNAEAGGKSKKSKAGADGAAGGGGVADGPEGGPKKKRQKKNPGGAGAAAAGAEGGAGASGGASSGAGAAAGAAGSKVSKKYNLSEDVQKRLTDSTATQLIGGKAYGWMSAGAGGGPGGKGKKGAKEVAKSMLPAPRFGSESAKRAEDGDGEEDDDGRGGTSSSALARKDITATPPLSGRRTDSHPSSSSSPSKGGAAGVGAWGDVAARKAAREEADRQRRLRVQMRDALFVLEEEVAGGVQGRGAGGQALMKARAKLGVVVVNPFEPAVGGGAGGGSGHL